MATSTLPGSNTTQRRRKQLTYGKTAHRETNRSALDFTQKYVTDRLSNVASIAPTAGPSLIASSNDRSSPAARKVPSRNDVVSRRQEIPQQKVHISPTRRPSPHFQKVSTKSRSSIFDVPSSDEDEHVERDSGRFQPQKAALGRLSSHKSIKNVKTGSIDMSTTANTLMPTTPTLKRKRKISHPIEANPLISTKTPPPKVSGIQSEKIETTVQAPPRGLTHFPDTSPRSGSKRCSAGEVVFPNTTSQRPIRLDTHETPCTMSTPRKAQTYGRSGSYGQDIPKTSPANHTISAETLSPEFISSNAVISRAAKSWTPPDLDSNYASTPTTPKQEKLWTSILPAVSKFSESPTVPLTAPQRSDMQTFKKGNVARLRLIDSMNAAQHSSTNSDSDYSEHDEDEDSQASLEEGLIGDSQATLRDSTLDSQQSIVGRSQSRLTYAGEQRSYLDEASVGVDDLLTVPLIAETSDAAAAQLAQEPHVRRRRPMDRTVIEDAADETSQGMRSIHELRAAGDSFRFENDLLLEDLNGKGKQFLSRKRNALLDICSKMVDTTFRERFVQFGLELRIIEACEGETDAILLASGAAALIYVLEPLGSVHVAMQIAERTVLSILEPLVELDKDLLSITKDRKSNMSKVAQASVVRLQDELLKGHFWDDSAGLDALTPQDLSLKAWELLTRRWRSGGNLTSLVDRADLLKLLQILEAKLDLVLGKDGLLRSQVMVHLGTILSLLESLTIEETCALDISIWDADMVNRMVNCLDIVLSLNETQASATFALVLRTCLNLANNHEGNCEAFSKTSFITRIMDSINDGFRCVQEFTSNISSSNNLDQLLLSLGALLNLAEWSSAARLAVVSDVKRLDTMLQTFLESRQAVTEADSLAASSANVAYGYLAVLLGNLCRTKRVRMHIQAQLPTQSLRIIHTAVEEFLAHHKEADRASDGNHSWVAFTDRLIAVGEMLRQFGSE